MSNSAGNTPQKVGKRRTSYERHSTAEINKKLSEALKRLGEPDISYRGQADRMVRRRSKK
jgi:hypothetical protein